MLDRISPRATALDFPANPNVGDIYQNWQWDGTRWMAAPVGPVRQDIPHCGKLVLASASPSTIIQFVPYKGDLIQINGVVYHLPAGGLMAGYNNCYINGVAGQALAASTLYWVYVFNSFGTLTLDFSPTGRATSTQSNNMGVEIKQGDNTRTFVGVVATSGNSQFYDTPQYRYTRSWFNRGLTALYGAASGPAGYNATTLLLGLPFMAFAGERVSIRAGSYGVTLDYVGNSWCYLTLAGTNSPYSAVTFPWAGAGYYESKFVGIAVEIPSDGLYVCYFYAYAEGSAFNGQDFPWMGGTVE